MIFLNRLDKRVWMCYHIKILNLALGPDGSALSNYIGYTSLPGNLVEPFTPIGVLTYYLSRMLAWENLSLRDLASHYEITTSNSREYGGSSRRWPSQYTARKFVLALRHAQC